MKETEEINTHAERRWAKKKKKEENAITMQFS